MTPSKISSTEQQLRSLLEKRLLILDGAMGTMIQQYKLTEADYRGARFADFVAPAGQRELFVKGNNELLTLTQSHIIQEIHEKYFLFLIGIADIYSFLYFYYQLDKTLRRQWNKFPG